MHLFHFSEDPDIQSFIPRPRPARPIPNRPDQESLVWAINEWHSPMYFFPRECPRLLLWPVESTTRTDVAEWMGSNPPRMIAYIEQGWVDRFESCVLYRYTFDSESFESLDDAGMYVSSNTVQPIDIQRVGWLRETMGNASVELRTVDSLQDVAHAVQATLHCSAIRSKNAAEWNPPS